MLTEEWFSSFMNCRTLWILKHQNKKNSSKTIVKLEALHKLVTKHGIRESKTNSNILITVHKHLHTDTPHHTHTNNSIDTSITTHRTTVLATWNHSICKLLHTHIMRIWHISFNSYFMSFNILKSKAVSAMLSYWYLTTYAALISGFWATGVHARDTPTRNPIRAPTANRILVMDFAPAIWNFSGAPSRTEFKYDVKPHHKGDSRLSRSNMFYLSRFTI